MSASTQLFESPALGPCERLASVLELTRQMVELARDGDWDEVAALEKQRYVDLQQCFADPIAPEHGPLVSQALEKMLTMNDRLINDLTTARDSVREQETQQARRRRALGQYQSVGMQPRL
ncbi:MAG: flagellar protein FliT [Pseudomonadota bacterium]